MFLRSCTTVESRRHCFRGLLHTFPSKEIRGPVMTQRSDLDSRATSRACRTMPSRGGPVFKTACDGVMLVQVWNLYRSPPCTRITIPSQFPRFLRLSDGPKSGKAMKVGTERGSQPQPSSSYHVRVGVNVVLASSSSNFTCEPVWTMKSRTTHRKCLTRKLLRYLSNLHTVSTLVRRGFS